jgi:hypothetical protein
MILIRLFTAFPLLALAVSTGAAETAAPKPHTYALVSAIGSKMTYVRLKVNVGSHLEPYQRYEMNMPDSAVDAAALRGLERVILQEDPTAQCVYLKLNPKELEGTYAYEEGGVAIGKLVAAFEKMPQRKDWHRIVVLTPRYVNSEREGLGSKLHGIGVYVRPIGAVGNDSFGDTLMVEPDTVSPEGKPGRSTKFIAPFFYAQVWVLDATTLAVLETRERYDFQRLYDPDSTAINIEDSIPPEKLAPAIEKFVEQSSARALREAVGVVTVGEPREVKPR